MHFREAKLPVHAQLESAVGGNVLPQIFTESEHLKHIDALIDLQEQYRVKAIHRIFSVHKLDRSYTMIKNTTQILYSR